MNDQAARPPNENGSAFVRVGTDLVEVAANGFVPREVHLLSDGRPKSACEPPTTTTYDYEIGPGGEMPIAPPGTPEFADWWGSIGVAISREEFERTFREAKEDPIPYRDWPEADQMEEDRARRVAYIIVAVLVVLAGLVILSVLLLGFMAAQFFLG